MDLYMEVEVILPALPSALNIEREDREENTFKKQKRAGRSRAERDMDKPDT